MPSVLPNLPSPDMAWIAIPLAILLYVLLLYDARRTGSPAAGDDQLGIKLVAATLAVMGTWVLANGLQGFLVTILTFDDFWDRLKAAVPSLVVGALVLAGAGRMLLPRTNAAHYPKAKRLAAGVVALVAGVALVPALVTFLEVLLEWPSWRLVATALAGAITAGVVFVVALAVLGRLSGVHMPQSMPAMRSPAGVGQPLGGVVQPQQAQPQQGQPFGGVVQSQPQSQPGYAGQPGAQSQPYAAPPAGATQPGTSPPGGWPQA